VNWLKKAIGKATGRTGRKHAETLVTRGYVAIREGHLDDALKAFVDAGDADETLATAFFDAGTTELLRFNRDATQLDDDARAARLVAAARWLDRAVALDELHAPSWRALARVRERQGALVAAHAAWTTVVALLMPADGGGAVAGGPAADGPATALAEARREQLRLQPHARLHEALTDARAALELVGDDDVTRAARQTALDGLLGAWATAQPAGAVEPRHLFALAGSLARKAGDAARAREMLDEAVRRDKHDVEAWKELATVCMTAGDLRGALVASLAAYREDPVDAGLVCNVGVCHLALGDVDKAAEFIDLARGMAPDDDIVQRALAALTAAKASSSTR
jgi:tetratricopeptide (TPR) repeat protein